MEEEKRKAMYGFFSLTEVKKQRIAAMLSLSANHMLTCPPIRGCVHMFDTVQWNTVKSDPTKTFAAMTVMSSW